MKLSDQFICASEQYNELHAHVCAPYLRKTFVINTAISSAEITVCGLGFYRLWINGEEITKGMLAPYISNPDDVIYYDNYDLRPYLREGKNALGFLLGNGNLNNPGGFVWNFETAPYRSAPKLAFSADICLQDGSGLHFEADETVVCADSPVTFDDLRAGEHYDATKEIPGWATPDYDDAGWESARKALCPRGEKRICEAQPILPTGELLSPVRILRGGRTPFILHSKKKLLLTQEPAPDETGYIYDFGKNTAGVIRLRIRGRRGQRIEIQCAESIDENGNLDYSNIKFLPDGYSQRDVFICSGEEDEYVPSFTYHGFSCCLVIGLEPEQATKDLLSLIVCNSALKKAGDFQCSDPVVTQLYQMTCNSDLSNFYYFPTDCPHREKNGWTGDAALSAQHFFMNYDCLQSLREWIRNMVKAQKPDGSLPGIVPTNNWGYDVGPAWDIALVELPFRAYQYTGDLQTAEVAADAIMKYIDFLKTKTDDRGLLSFGLGDWCSVDWKQDATLTFTCSVTVVDLCAKAAFLYQKLGMPARACAAETMKEAVRSAVRTHLVDLNTFTADSRCQTSQAMALYYHIFEPSEEGAAFRVLTELIHENNDFLDVGILGARVLFHVLAEHGESVLAYRMITRLEWPSYGYWIKQGLTALSEQFVRDDGVWESRNHHMFGDISNWFISRIAGLRYNPDVDDPRLLLLSPSFLPGMTHAAASFTGEQFGKISVEWKREGDAIRLNARFSRDLIWRLDIVPQREGESFFTYTGEPVCTESGREVLLSCVLTKELAYQP